MPRVAIPTSDGETLAHFGIAEKYLINDVQDGKVVAREERISPDPGHTASNHHKLVLDQVRDVQVVIAEHMGPPMVRSLRQLGILTLRAPSGSVAGSLEAYLRDPSSLRAFRLDEAAPPAGHEAHADHDHEH